MAQTVYSPAINTYTPLATITLSSSASSVTFSNINQSFRDLVIVIRGGASAYTGSLITANGSTSNFSFVQMTGTSGGASSNSGSNNNFGVVNSSCEGIIQIMDYSATDKHKTLLGRFGANAADVRAVASRWASLSAMTSFGIYPDGSNTWNIGTTFSLYGIAA